MDETFLAMRKRFGEELWTSLENNLASLGYQNSVAIEVRQEAPRRYLHFRGEGVDGVGDEAGLVEGKIWSPLIGGY